MIAVFKHLCGEMYGIKSVFTAADEDIAVASNENSANV